MLLALLLACTGGDPIVITPESTISLQLLNPTLSDPMLGVDSLRLQLEIDGLLVVDEVLDADAPAEIPELIEYGLGRFYLSGLSGGEVVSYGRSKQVLVAPETDLSVPILFLPINQALPLAESMSKPRSEHATAVLPDGSVVLMGGRDPGGDNAFDDIEVYDPSTGTFSSSGTRLPAKLQNITVSEGPDREVLLVGGELIAELGPRSVDFFAELDTDSLSIDQLATLNIDRARPCFSLFREGFGIAFGGTDESGSADYLRPDAGTGDWNWTEVVMDELDAAQVSGCATTPDGKLFIQGLTEEATGVFDYTEAAANVNPDVRGAFYPINASSSGDHELLDGAMIVAVDSDRIWIGGGVEPGGGPSTQGRTFSMVSRTFVNGVDPLVARVDGEWSPWIEDGWIALGCGSPDGDPTRAQASVEVLDVVDGDRTPSIVTDRQRPGCRLNVLHDGAVFISGGYGPGDDTKSSAAVVVPYID